MSWDETDLINKADINIYKELITIDEKLGTKMTEQLFHCVKYSFRKDLFKVWKDFFDFLKINCLDFLTLIWSDSHPNIELTLP